MKIKQIKLTKKEQESLIELYINTRNLLGIYFTAFKGNIENLNFDMWKLKSLNKKLGVK